MDAGDLLHILFLREFERLRRDDEPLWLIRLARAAVVSGEVSILLRLLVDGPFLAPMTFMLKQIGLLSWLVFELLKLYLRCTVRAKSAMKYQRYMLL